MDLRYAVMRRIESGSRCLAAASSDMSERRINQRYAVRLAVEIDFNGQNLKCSAADVSIGGIKLEFGQPLPISVGDQVGVTLRLPALDDAVAASAVVRWVDRVDERVCGVQFTRGLRAREVWAINRLFDAAR